MYGLDTVIRLTTNRTPVSDATIHLQSDSFVDYTAARTIRVTLKTATVADIVVWPNFCQAWHCPVQVSHLSGSKKMLNSIIGLPLHQL